MYPSHPLADAVLVGGHDGDGDEHHGEEADQRPEHGQAQGVGPGRQQGQLLGRGGQHAEQGGRVHLGDIIIIITIITLDNIESYQQRGEVWRGEAAAVGVLAPPPIVLRAPSRRGGILVKEEGFCNL